MGVTISTANAGATYVPIATYTLPSNGTTYNFSSIPSIYTDIVVVVNASCTATGQWIGLQYNSDTGNNYSDTVLEGNGSSATSNRDANTNHIQIVYQLGTDSTFGTAIFNIQNYSNSTTHKPALARWNYAGNGTGAAAATWRSTSAINLIRIYSSGTMTAGSTFTLYGIRCA